MCVPPCKGGNYDTIKIDAAFRRIVPVRTKPVLISAVGIWELTICCQPSY